MILRRGRQPSLDLVQSFADTEVVILVDWINLHAPILRATVARGGSINSETVLFRQFAEFFPLRRAEIKFCWARHHANLESCGQRRDPVSQWTFSIHGNPKVRRMALRSSNPSASVIAMA